VFCSISLLSVYMCVRMPLSLRSIAGVPSSQALPGYLITAHHLRAFLLYLARKLCGGMTKKNKSYACMQYKQTNKQTNKYATHTQKVRMCAHTQDPRGVGLCVWWEKKEGEDAWMVAQKCVAVEKKPRCAGTAARREEVYNKVSWAWWVFRHGIILPG